MARGRCVIVAVASFGRGVPDVFFCFLGSRAGRGGPEFTEEAIYGGNLPREVPLTKNVPVLRVNHCTCQGILFGVWEVAARSSPVSAG